jgi:hypothetical protein
MIALRQLGEQETKPSHLVVGEPAPLAVPVYGLAHGRLPGLAKRPPAAQIEVGGGAYGEQE